MNYYNYYTEIEEHFVRRRKKNLTISPLDWSLIQTWKEAGIPLHVALRGIDRAFDAYDARPTRKRLVNTLFYCQQAVQESYDEYVQSRVGQAPEEGAAAPLVERKETEGWLERFSSEVQAAQQKAAGLGMEELAEVFTRALVRLSDISIGLPPEGEIDIDGVEKDLQILDDLITDGVRQAMGPEKVQSWVEEAKAELKPYKKRVSPEMYEKILNNFLRRRARQQFLISPLTLFQV